jgi:hypothetical protein
MRDAVGRLGRALSDTLALPHLSTHSKMLL